MRRLPIKELRKRRKILLAFAIIISMLIVICAIDLKLRSSVGQVATTAMNRTVISAINLSAGEVISKEQVGYSQLVDVNYNQSGGVNFAQFNVANISLLKTKLTETINKNLSSGELCNVYIPVGTLTESTLLNGLGPKLEVRAELYNSVDVEITSEFIDKGINQTLHRIMLCVSADMYILMPGNKKTTTITTSYCIAETLIVGDVPSAYTLIEEMPGDTAGVINDYGAEIVS